MKKIVVFTGAGVSADSGLSTFRDADGLWANYRIEDVCTPEALMHNRPLVVEFYNKRRKELLATQPNPAHYAIAELERHFDVEVVTQNVDDLHERAGSSRVTHLHGELMKRNINYVGAEVLFKRDDSHLASHEFIDMMHRDGKLVWVNTIIYNHKHQLSAGHSDDAAICGDRDFAWAAPARRGFDFIQTDWTAKLVDYLKTQNLLYRK